MLNRHGDVVQLGLLIPGATGLGKYADSVDDVFKSFIELKWASRLFKSTRSSFSSDDSSYNPSFKMNIQLFASKGMVKLRPRVTIESYSLSSSRNPNRCQISYTLLQKYNDIMKKVGINIHEVKYLKGIDPKIHSRITTEWSKWDKALGRTPTADDVMDFDKKDKREIWQVLV